MSRLTAPATLGTETVNWSKMGMGEGSQTGIQFLEPALSLTERAQLPPREQPGAFPQTALNEHDLSSYYHSRNFFTNDYPLYVPLCRDTWQQGHGRSGDSLVLTSTPTAARSDPAKHVVGKGTGISLHSLGACWSSPSV